jgi:hypothetical protein
MTIAELIEELQNYPQDTRVVVRGYEAGVNDVDYVEETEIYLNYNTASYYGKHEVVEYDTPRDCEKVPAVYLRN